MNFLASFRADQFVTQLLAQEDLASPAAMKLIDKLKKAGNRAVPKVIDGMALSDKTHRMVLVDILSELINDKNLDLYREGLADGNDRVVSGTAFALSSSTSYNANKLLEFFDDEEVSKPHLIEVLKVHKQDLSVHELLQRAYECESREKAALFKIIEETVRPEMVPDLVARMGGKDPAVKVHLMHLLAQLENPEINQALEMQLSDSNKQVRSAALAALSRRGGHINIEKVARLLTDPDLEVQNKAVDVMISANHPDTVQFLVEALKDESEYARRAAVEVLNEVGDENSVKDLLGALKDNDWWVRSRAGDALAEIGGPKVVDSVLTLINDKDDDIRRTAIEILNATKDPRAVDQLIKATDDADWWVRERAVDALSKIGDPKALPKLESMLGQDSKTDTVVVRAIAKLGDHKHVTKLMPMLKSPEREVQLETVKALSQLADEGQADSIRELLQKVKDAGDGTIINVADQALKDLAARFAAGAPAMDEAIAEAAQTTTTKEPTKTQLMESEDLDALLQAQADEIAARAKPAEPVTETGSSAAPPILDIQALNPGDLIENRYRYIEKIGKGAFGTVLLMEDEVVDEQLILKFLNANVSSDDEMMKRFVHELRYSRKITHRNIIRIYDFLSVQGCYAISMEYFPSHTLSGEIPGGKPMPFGKVIQYSKDIAAGMTVAHEAGVIHRDLKPANILVNTDGLLKIVDFGVAAAATTGDTDLTKTGYVIGSPKYMAPEQILGKKVDRTADIYSVGVIMYEMATGIPPYSKGDHMSVMYQHVQGKAAPCQDVNPEIPDEFAAIISKAMTVDRTQRFQSMQELTEALEAIVV